MEGTGFGVICSWWGKDCYLMFVEIAHPWLKVVVSALVKPSLCTVHHFLSEIYFLQGPCSANGCFQFITGAGLCIRVLNFSSFNILGRIVLYLGNRVAVQCIVQCSLFGSVPGFGTPDATNILLVGTGKIISGHCQMQSKSNLIWYVRTTILHGNYFLVL